MNIYPNSYQFRVIYQFTSNFSACRKVSFIFNMSLFLVTDSVEKDSFHFISVEYP